MGISVSNTINFYVLTFLFARLHLPKLPHKDNDAADPVFPWGW